MDQNNNFVYCLAASPNFANDGIIFAAKQDGLYISSDGGQNWSNAYASLDLDSALPTTFVTVCLSEGQLFVFASVEGNILRSIDGGSTWAFANLSSPPPVVTSMVASFNFAQEGLLLAGTMQDGIFRSTSHGANWSGWNFGLFDSNVNALAISPKYDHDQTLFAGTQSSVFQSINGGRSWRDLDFPVELAPVLCISMDLNNNIFAGSEDQGLFVSQDRGKTWNQLIEGTIEQILVGEDHEILILNDGEIKFSGNSGQSWRHRVEIESIAAITSLVAPLGIKPDQPLWAGLSNGEIQKI